MDVRIIERESHLNSQAEARCTCIDIWDDRTNDLLGGYVVSGGEGGEGKRTRGKDGESKSSVAILYIMNTYEFVLIHLWKAIKFLLWGQAIYHAYSKQIIGVTL